MSTVVSRQKINYLLSRIEMGESIIVLLKEEKIVHSNFKEALKHYGYENKYSRAKEKRKKYRSEQIFNKMLALAQELKRIPSTKEIRKLGSFEHKVIRLYINRLSQLGFVTKVHEVINRRLQKYRRGLTVSEIAADENVTKEAVRHSLRPTGELIHEYTKSKQKKLSLFFEIALQATLETGIIPGVKGFKSLEIPIGYFAEIRKKLAEQGFKIVSSWKKRYSDQKLIDELKRIKKIVKRTPSKNDLAKYGTITSETYISRFGNFRKAQIKAGMKPNRQGSQKKLTRKSLLDDLKKLSRKINRTPTKGDLAENGLSCSVSYSKFFGGLRNAQRLAGLPINKNGPKKEN